MQPNGVVMTVLRDGYWNGAYPRRGDTIIVEPEWVKQLEQNEFAVQQRDEPPRPEPRAKKGK
jgi:hypothetical protein